MRAAVEQLITENDGPGLMRARYRVRMCVRGEKAELNYDRILGNKIRSLEQSL